MQTNQYERIKRYLTETTFNIWLRLVGLTLISAIIAETKNTAVIATVFVCAIVMMKGHWIIEEFMGLKHAAPLFRKIIKGYFLCHDNPSRWNRGIFTGIISRCLALI